MILSASLFAQELREEVLIIRAEPKKALSETYTGISIWLENIRESDLANEVKGKKNGVHGTVFSVLDEEGKRLFITNYHVIAGSETISVEWQSEDDGSSTVIDDCEVVYADPFRDLALIKIPQDSQLQGKGMSLQSNSVSDGMEVWAAGYPGLISSPVWQLSKGSVSNQRTVIKELVKEGLPFLIQHTSVIDPGSSGGPLMIKEGDIFNVVGVNTLSANNRHNTFYSIPAESVTAFIDEYSSGVTDADENGLEETLVHFTGVLGSQEDPSGELPLFLSDDFALSVGWDMYLERRNDLSSKERESWDNAILLNDTLEGLKSFIAKDLANASDSASFKWSITEYSPDVSEVILISDDKDAFVTEWTFSKGKWVLSDYPLSYEVVDEAEEAKEEDAKDANKYAFRTAIAFFGGGSYSFGKDSVDAPGLGGFSLGIEILSIHNKYLGSSAIIGYEKLKLIKENWTGGSSEYDAGAVLLGYGLNIFPTKLIRAHTITPVIKAGIGIGVDISAFGDVSGSPFLGYWTAGGGIHFTPKGKDIGIFGAMVDYKSVSSIMNMDGEDVSGSAVNLTLSYILKL